jgi:hypothetical protein
VVPDSDVGALGKATITLGKLFPECNTRQIPLSKKSVGKAVFAECFFARALDKKDQKNCFFPSVTLGKFHSVKKVSAKLSLPSVFLLGHSTKKTEKIAKFFLPVPPASARSSPLKSQVAAFFARYAAGGI